MLNVTLISYLGMKQLQKLFTVLIVLLIGLIVLHLTGFVFKGSQWILSILILTTSILFFFTARKPSKKDP